MKKFDYLIVGSGIFGAVFARKVMDAGKTVLVIEKRKHLGGNVRCREVEGINVHEFGAHIFHTKNKAVWDFVNSYVEFNRYTNCPIACYKGEIYNMPFNMNTFHAMWGVVTPAQAKAVIEKQRSVIKGEPQNLEEQAISLVGTDIYQKLVKGYTEKQWGRDCKDLPAFIIRRLPVRFTYDNNYFNDPYQGIPIGGYTQIFEKLLAGCEVRLNADYLSDANACRALATRVLFTGPIDEYYGYCLGALEYRSLRFEHVRMEDTDNFQGNAVFNYTDVTVPYTRSIEHKHFEFGRQPTTVVSYEYSQEWHPGIEPYYPLNDAKNQELYRKYCGLSQPQDGVVFGGRLGTYRYTDMQDTIISALEMVEDES